MRNLILIAFLIFSTTLLAQNYSYVGIKNANYNQNVFVYQNNNSGLFSIADAIDNFRNSLIENQKTMSQLQLVKNQYLNTNSFPEKIEDGWHLIMYTDNYNYIDEAKVLIEKNEIKRFVVNNYDEYSVKFKTITPIVNAKSMVNLYFKDETTDIVELYFLYDLNQTTIVPPPLQSGYLIFWSDIKKGGTAEIRINNKLIGRIPQMLDNIPACDSDNIMRIKLKPGKYDFRAAGRGGMDWSGYVVIKENNCLFYKLDKSNKE